MSNIIDISNLKKYQKDKFLRGLEDKTNIKLISINDINEKFFNSFSKSYKSDICSICLENIEVRQQTCNLDCNHIFHKKCLKKYLNKNLMNFSCPNCKKCYNNKIKDLIIN